MAEGPSIVMRKEEIQSFTGQKIITVEGNSKLDLERLRNKKIIAFPSWGKHFLICFDKLMLRIHFMLFGTYRINEKKETPVRLHLGFRKGELNFYTCSLKYLEGDVIQYYDWLAEMMNADRDPTKARKKMREHKEAMIRDVLLYKRSGFFCSNFQLLYS